MSETIRVHHWRTLPLRGSSATTIAPAVGTKVASVNMESVSTNTFLVSVSSWLVHWSKVRRKSKIANDQQDCRAQREPACIRANVAGLQPLYDRAESLRGCTGSETRAVDDSTVDKAFEQVSRNKQQGRDDECAVNLIDPVLVEQQSIESAEL